MIAAISLTNCESVLTFPAGTFIYPAKNGLAVTGNSGETFQVSALPLFTEARYGAFPTANTWYIAAGEFPDNSDDTPLRRFAMQDKNGRFPAENSLLGDDELGNNTNNGYSAQLVVTTNAGKVRQALSRVAKYNKINTHDRSKPPSRRVAHAAQTWTTVLAQNNTFYFNGVDCDPNDANHCCAAAEGFDVAGAGAHIFCTTNGSARRTLISLNNSINCIRDSCCFGADGPQCDVDRELLPGAERLDRLLAAGHPLLQLHLPLGRGRRPRCVARLRINCMQSVTAAGSVTEAWFLRSNDGGQTWAQGSPTLYGLYAMSLASPSVDVSYASGARALPRRIPSRACSRQHRPAECVGVLQA